MRVIFIKPDCEKCEEALRAVDFFNKLHPNNNIRVIESTYPSFDMYIQTITPLLAGEDEFSTPFIVFDYKAIDGICGWRELLSYLNNLHTLNGRLLHV